MCYNSIADADLCSFNNNSNCGKFLAGDSVFSNFGCVRHLIRHRLAAWFHVADPPLEI